MAPLVKKFLSPRGDVIFDARTNTLIVTDIE
jgi:type II secretory pathway component HofQ